jgi:phenylpropionate dioxygenase-like ring-hydroxylating dioxygenase large terminal subunit
MSQTLNSSINLGLPAHYYTDSEIFERELKNLWRSTWQMVGRVEDIPHPGDYFTCTLGEEPILVVRDMAGMLSAMHNVCPHRGVRLLDDKGTCKHRITCPYHAWTFGLDGELLGVSQPKLFPNLDKSSIRLLPVKVDTWGGFIFVKPDIEGESLVEYLAEFPQFLKHHNYQWEDLREIDRRQYDEPINWKIIVENYVEIYHVPVAHQNSLNLIYDVANSATLPTGRHLLCAMRYAQRHSGERIEREPNQTAYEGYIFPNLMINSNDQNVLVFRLTPLSPTRTLWEVLIYQTPEQQEQYLVDKPSYDVVMEEDIRICHNLQAAVGSRTYGIKHLALEQEQTGINHFHQTLSEYL